MFKIGDWTGSEFPCQIIGRIPGGSMAQLFLARLKNTDHLFAVKAVENTENMQAQILRKEGEILSQLYHKNIPGFFGYFEDVDKQYFIMEYQEKIRTGVLSEKEIQHILLELCELLAYIHGKGIVHGDLKPSNLLLKPKGEIMLLDYGMAGYVAEKGQKSLFQGTMGYAAPECWHKENISLTPQTDIFSLGALMYFLLEGKEPKEHFGKFIISDTQKKNRWQPVLNKCCALHMQYRYESAAKVFDVIKKIRC